MKISRDTSHRDVEKLLKEGVIITTEYRGKGIFKGYHPCIYQDFDRYGFSDCKGCLGEVIIETADFTTKSYCMQHKANSLIREIDEGDFIKKHEFTI